MNPIRRRWQCLFDPPRFQGWGRRRSYFEGWYFKIVVPEQNLAYAFIPGVSYDADGSGHAFLQVLDGVAAKSRYHRYPVEDFRPAEDRFSVQLAGHRFSAQHLVIALPDLRVDLTLLSPHAWHPPYGARLGKLLAPGIMGWYGFVPRMQCYHGLVSYHHALAGEIVVGGERFDAAGGVGYTEKDWGSGFPEAWVWCQSNHLSGTTSPACLMASFATIPWLGTTFNGYLATFLLEGEVHLFTTWASGTGPFGRAAHADPAGQVRAEFGEEQRSVTLTFTAPGKRLRISGSPAPGGTLASPITAAGMVGKINESLRATLAVTLWVDDRVAYDGLATWAGLEVSENAPTALA